MARSLHFASMTPRQRALEIVRAGDPVGGARRDDHDREEMRVVREQLAELAPIARDD